MRRGGVLILTLVSLALGLGCDHATEVPAVPAPPEDLSTWSVPELVQLPPAALPDLNTGKDKPTAAERVYDFTPGTTFALIVPVGWPLDIVLERGEQVRNIVGGDRAPAEVNQGPRWDVKEGAEGLGETLRSHVFVTASTPGLTTGVLITTTKRTYYLTCKSVHTSPTRVVRWRYLHDPTEKLPQAKEPGLLPDPVDPKRWHVGYEMTTSQPPPSWQPRSIVDDGKKVYIIYPEVTLFDIVPLIRLVGVNGPQLVNVRQVLNVAIVDQLVARAELRIGRGEQAETVTITRGALRTIACPGDPACPVWPGAAAGLARRQP